MIGAKRDVAEMLGEEEPRSIMERLRRKEQEKERINIFIFQKHKTKYIKNA